MELIRGDMPGWAKSYGSGSGDGSGYGYGYGYGYGSGYGSGSGYGYGEYWLAAIPGFTATWTSQQRARLDVARSHGARLAYWRSNKDGTPANGGTGGARKAGDVERIPGPLRLCGGGALHATETPPKWEGKRVWIVALFGEVLDDGDKLGALHREILGEAWCEP